MRDTIWMGLLIGFITPPAVFAMVYVPGYLAGRYFTPNFYETMSLFCIGVNALLMWIVMNRYEKDRLGRGILLINLAYALAFTIVFYGIYE